MRFQLILAAAAIGGVTAGATSAPAPAPTTIPKAPGFPTEAEARAKCAGDTIVWVNLKSGVYYFAGTRNYGHTRSGAFMCEKAAQAAGDRAAKRETHPRH